jgi:hypothetical protein
VSEEVRHRNSGCRITTNIFYGEIPALVIENEFLRLTILEGRGADVVECLYKPTDLDLAWLTQWGIPHQSVPADYPPNVESFLNGYPGGWQSIFPNGGAPCTYDGIEFAQHDEVALLAWDHEVLNDREDQVEVRFTVRTNKTPFKVSKTFLLRSNERSCVVTEEITNLSNEKQRAMWGFHISLGAPFLTEDSIIRLPNNVTVLPHQEPIADTGRRLDRVENFTWPTFHGKNGSAIDFSHLPKRGTESEMLYLTGFNEPWYQVENPHKRLAMKVSWDLELMPYLWYWQEFGSSTSYPWFGKHYNIGLEPFSSFPTNGLAQAVENDTALTFAPGEKKASVIKVEVIAL